MSQQKETVPQVIIVSKEPIVFAGKAAGLENFFRLEHRRVKIGEREDDRIVWKRGDFVLIVAMGPNRQKIVLIREFKQAVEQVLLGLPAGAVRKGETPIDAALRELKEETGYTGNPFFCYQLGPFFNSPDKSTERHFVVIVDGVWKEMEAAPEENETILGSQLVHIGTAIQKVRIGMHLMAVHVALQAIAEWESTG